ncbi:MAG: hypothetical protein SWK76_01805 [Actinomycetota bacterium]|nr:hypothetical protein [Actinomycetota bacterium]
MVIVYEQHDERYLGYAADTMTMSLTDLGYRVIDSVKAGGLWAAGDASRDEDALRKAMMAGENFVRMLRLKGEIEEHLKSIAQE